MGRRLAVLAAALWLAAPASAGFVSVGGRRLYYECRGSGRPVVVLDAGSPDTTATWRWVQPRLARTTRVCAYDRAGLGRSEPPRPGRRTALTQVDELHALLRAARIPGPYVLVGHSWGGLLVRLYAHRYARETAGAVLLDATTFPYLTPATARRLHRRGREGVDLPAAIAESDAVRSLGSIPLVVLGSNRPPLDPKLLAAQEAEAALSTDSVDATARRSTHYLQAPAPRGQPGLVVVAVDAVVAAVRRHAQLQACRRLFRPADAICR